jgi:cytochrome c oxidase subunit 2
LLAAQHILAGILIPERGGSPNADSIAALYTLILVMAVIVFIGVEGALITFLIRFKARRGRVAAQIHGNTRLEIGWTVGAAVILVFITVVTFIKLPGIKNPPASDIDANGAKVASTTLFASTDQSVPPKGAKLNIVVDGQQYVWRFQYPSVGGKEVFSYEEMVVPVGMTVTLDITADDVAHSWWIPKLGGKADALPGYTNHTWFKATKAGTFPGQCAELCGRNHANMLARVKAVPFDQYKAWYDQQAADIKAARDAGAKQRAAMLKQQQEAAQRSATQ